MIQRDSFILSEYYKKINNNKDATLYYENAVNSAPSFEVKYY